MFKSYRNLLLSAAAVAAVSTTLFAGSDASHTYANGKKVIDGGVTYPEVNGKRAAYYVNEAASKGGFTYGRMPTKNEIKAWDIDVMPDGTGLPEGKGTVEEGDEIYEEKCASCHFDFGTGGAGYPALQKGNAAEGQQSLTNQRTGPDMDGPVRVFGTYWPQASTLWWYIKTGMPHPAPMSLSDDEVYALVAYILSINEIEIDGEELEDEYELDREKFMKIVMPNKDGFIPKIDGPKGPDNAREFFNDPKNYGNGTRCMKNCFDGEPVLARISGNGISDYEPPITTKRALPPKKEGDAGAEHPGKKTYEASCSLCHAPDTNPDAPVVGDKKAWETALKKGLDKVYANGIEGINGMPPRGGTSLDDKKFKEVVDYMIEASK
jgi:cytochrome c